MQPKIYKHVLCNNTLKQYFKNLEQGLFRPLVTSVGGGAKQPPPSLMFPKYCKKFIGAQNMPIHLTPYVLNRGVDASRTNLLKKALG